MSENKIKKLTLEQKALIPVYREKWKKIALSTERIDGDKATEAVKQAYAFIGEKEPEILFFKSPYRALQNFSKHISRWTKIFMSLRATAKQSQSVAMIHT